MKNKTTYTKITAKIIFVTLAITLASAYIYSGYMKQSAIINLSQIDAKKPVSSFLNHCILQCKEDGIKTIVTTHPIKTKTST